MSMPTVYRDVNHTDGEHEARVNGFDAGWTHANYAANVDPNSPDSALPERFADVADVWHEAYQDGKDEYKATEEDECTYGHDWRG